MSTTPATIATDPLTGRWAVDPGHSSVEFRVRHAGVARVRGAFDVFEGELVSPRGVRSPPAARSTPPR